MAKVSVENSTITAENGFECRYELRKVRRWNIGARKHMNELTGEITVVLPSGSFKHFPNWETAKSFVETNSKIAE